MSQNRILKYFGADKRKVAIQPLEGKPEACAFCGEGLAGSHLNAASVFNKEDSTAPLAVICSRCIDQLAGMSKLTGWYQRYFRDENFWGLLEGMVRKRLAGENGTEAMRDAVAGLLVRLTKRACAIIAGHRRNGLEVCQKTGVPLGQPRIALVSSDQEGIMNMIYAGADVIGLPLLIASPFEASNGSAYRSIKRTKCNGDSVHAENGLILVADEFPKVSEDVGVLYLVEDGSSVPAGIEIIEA